MLICSLLVGCNPPDGNTYSNEDISASGVNSMKSSDYVESYDAETTEEDSNEVKDNSIDKEEAIMNRKLIKDVDLQLETKDLDKSQKIIDKQVADYNGYIETSNYSNGDLYNPYSYSEEETKSLYLKIRIESSKLDDFLNSLEEVGTIQSENYNVKDVTLEYSDLETHKNALRMEQERILELLNEATDLEYILTLEDKLSDIRYELENYESQLKLYNNLIDYSTINVTLTEVSHINKTSVSMKDRIVNGWQDTLYTLKSFVEDVIVFVIVNSPFIIIIILLIILCVKFGKKFIKIHEKKVQKTSSEETPNRIKEIIKNNEEIKK